MITFAPLPLLYSSLQVQLIQPSKYNIENRQTKITPWNVRIYKNRQQQQVHIHNFKYIRPDDIDNVSSIYILNAQRSTFAHLSVLSSTNTCFTAAPRITILICYYTCPIIIDSESFDFSSAYNFAERTILSSLAHDLRLFMRTCLKRPRRWESTLQRDSIYGPYSYLILQ